MTETTELKPDTDKESTQSPSSPFGNVESFFNEIVPKSWLRDFPSFRQHDSDLEMRTPSIDIIDNNGEIVIKAEVPGIDKKDLDISASNNSVVIKGATSTESTETHEDYLHSEIHRGSFLRTIPLPCAIDPDATKASFKDGILTLHMPKLHQTTDKKIDVD